MNDRQKRQLARVFAAPPPQKKQAFLRTLPQPQLTNLQFVRIQAHYIRGRVWLGSFLLFAAALCGAYMASSNTLQMISALVPFASLLVLLEQTRSAACGMQELELSCPFSLKSILLARMSILGLSHTLLLAGLIWLCCKNEPSAALRTGLYLLTPYLLTTLLGLHTTRHVHPRDAAYACAGTAACVSGLQILLHVQLPHAFTPAYTHIWLLLCAVCLALTAKQWQLFLKRRTEYGIGC